jgi:hypothetical protein
MSNEYSREIWNILEISGAEMIISSSKIKNLEYFEIISGYLK